MRVWIITQANLQRVGGVATHIHLLDRGLREAGHEVEVIASGAMSRLLNYALISAPIRGLNLLKKGQGIRYAAAMHGALMSLRTAKMLNDGPVPDVFACQDVLSVDGLAVIRRRLQLEHIPILLTVHSRYTWEKVGQGWMAAGSRQAEKLLQMERRAFRRADAIVAVSDRLRAYVEEMAAPHPIHAITLQNATDLERFAPCDDPAERAATRAAHGIRQTAFVVLCSGHLQEIKGVEFAAKAAAEIKRRRPQMDWQLVFAGDGPRRGWLEQYSRQEGLVETVKLLGAQPTERMSELYRCADMLLMPSIPTSLAEEGLPLAAIEACACALPVVASASGGLVEIFRHEANGLLVPPKDAGSISDALGRLYDDRAFGAELGREARATAIERHEFRNHATAYADFAEGLYTPRHGHAVVMDGAAAS